MKPGKTRSSWHLPGAKRCFRAARPCALLVLLLPLGCRSDGPKVEQNLMSPTSALERSAAVARCYAVVCPDVLDLTFANHPELSGPHPVGVDGRLDLEPLGQPRVEGQTTEEIARQLAVLAGVPVEEISVRVEEYHGQCLYVFGEVMGLQRAVPYQGQETVIDLLRRIGGITAGAAPQAVYVVRPHIADGSRPEVFHVDLEGIVLRGDQRTNLRLEPYDQVHVGVTRRAGWEKVVPPWLRPLYERLCGWFPGPQKQPEPDAKVPSRAQ